MVGRVMECRGGAPLTNEIKIFKHCFTILPGLSYSFLVTYSLHGARQPPQDIIVVSLLIHNICLSEDRAQIHGRNIPAPYVSSASPQLIIPALITTLRTSKPPILLTTCLCARLYLFPLFIVTTLIWPLMISFCTHRVTMKDLGFKLASLQHPPRQLAFSNQ